MKFVGPKVVFFKKQGSDNERLEMCFAILLTMNGKKEIFKIFLTYVSVYAHRTDHNLLKKFFEVFLSINCQRMIVIKTIIKTSII